MPVQRARELVPPCLDRRGQLPDHCPGWCEYSDPDPQALRHDGRPFPTELPPGTLLPGGFRLGGVLCRGGMGTVYRGWCDAQDRPIAVKFLSAELADQPAVRGRFLSETRALARLQHPNIVETLGAGQYEGLPYLVMALADGEPLSNWIDLGMPIRHTLRIIAEIAEAVAAVHAAGTLHNDIKPDNVIVTEEGEVTLVDFGLARPFAPVCRLEPGEVAGTPQYVAPELAGGWVDAPSPATDIYALGVVAFEAFTGRAPFENDDPDALFDAHMYEDPPSLAALRDDLPARAAELFQQCLDKRPYARPPSAGYIARILRDLVDETETTHLSATG